MGGFSFVCVFMRVLSPSLNKVRQLGKEPALDLECVCSVPVCGSDAGVTFVCGAVETRLRPLGKELRARVLIGYVCVSVTTKQDGPLGRETVNRA